MKAGILFVAIFALSLVTIPMAALYYDDGVPNTIPADHSPAIPPATQETQNEVANQPETEDLWAQEADILVEGEDDAQAITVAEAEPEISENGVASFRILDQSTGKVNEVSVRDYVRGAVASEMPASFHPEALKAQAVAAHTYALHNHYAQIESPDPALKGADFAADPSNRKIYITEEQAKAFFGEPYADTYWEIVCQAADSTLSYILEYEDEPIVAAYHAISAGRTEAAENVWVGSADYLTPQDSEGDYLAPGYETEEVFSSTEIESVLIEAYPAIILPEDPAEWFADITRSESGYITNISLGGVDLHGKELRTLLNLRSHNMEIQYTDSGFLFIVYGYGHGVGLSQYGADFLARQGYTFDEILRHYYAGASLRMLDEPPAGL